MPGPVTLTFVTDDFTPAKPAGGGQNDPEMIDDLGWALQYSFSGSCTTLNPSSNTG